MQKSVEIKSNGSILRGMIHIPDGRSGEKIPMVCIFHGFMSGRVEPHFIFVKLSRMLENKGIASIRFDFMGSGESDGDFEDMTISGELEDAKNILQYVESLDFVDVSKIGVTGLSMGGAVASMLAGDFRNVVKSLCLWAPAGNMKEIIMDHIVGKDGVNELQKTGYYDVGGLKLGKKFLDDIFNVDIFKKASPYNNNVLLLHGNGDETVSIDTSYKYLDIYGPKAVLHIIEGADHTFNSVSWEKEVLDYTVGFFEGELKHM